MKEFGEVSERTLTWFMVVALVGTGAFAVLMLFAGNIISIIGALIIIIGLAIALIVHLHVWKVYHYDCPVCSTSFKPTFMRSLAAINCFEERKMRCPGCGSYMFMTALRDK